MGLGIVHKWSQPRGGREGVSQKLTKVDKEGGGILSKADVSQLSNFYDQNYDIRPLGALFALYERAPKLTNIFKSYIFSNFHLSYWTYLPKNMFLWPKLWLSFVPQNICLHQPVLKSWCQPGGEGGIFCQKLTEADKGGGRGQNWPNFGWRHLWTIPYVYTFSSCFVSEEQVVWHRENVPLQHRSIGYVRVGGVL